MKNNLGKRDVKMDVGWQKNLGDLGGVLRLMRVPCASGVMSGGHVRSHDDARESFR